MQKCAIVILEDPSERILLRLRDNIDTIPFPNMWAMIGGLVNEGESPEDAILREVREELECKDGTGYQLQHYRGLFTYNRTDIIGVEYVFHAPLTESVEDLILREGQRLELFDEGRIYSDIILPHQKEILIQYLTKYKISVMPIREIQSSKLI